MATLSSAKTLGMVGSILLVIGSVVSSFTYFIVALIGLILTLIAVKYIADVYSDQAIFRNIIIYVIADIVGVIIGAIFIVAAALSFVGLGSTIPTMPSQLPANWVSLVIDILVGLLIIWAALIISAFFLRKSFNSIAMKTGVGTFRTAALLYIIGAFLTIIIIGFILIWVAWIITIVAFSKLPENTTAAQPPAMPSNTAPPPPPSAPSTPV